VSDVRDLMISQIATASECQCAKHVRTSERNLQGAAKKWTSKVLRCFLSNRLEFWFEI